MCSTQVHQSRFAARDGSESTRATPSTRASLVTGLCRLIEAADTPPTLAELAQAAGTSESKVRRAFVQVTGVSPKRYAEQVHGERMRQALSGGCESVTGAIFSAGYGSTSRFYEGSEAALGMTPRAYRSAGAGYTIRFAVGECTLGSVLVAATEKGVCAILLGDDPAELVRELQRRFRRAEIIGGDVDFERVVAVVVGAIEAPGTGVDLPLDIRGTVFQQRVWSALREIPPGRTASYREIAERIGSPKASRAVAAACAANPLAVAIPCHRVVRTDGDISGYRWGVARKRELLEREAAQRGSEMTSDGALP